MTLTLLILEAPVEPEWKGSENMPFANHQAFVHVSDHDAFQAVESVSEIEVDWCSVGEMVEARIFVRDELLATLNEGAKPSCSLLVCKGGPPAKVLES